MNTQTQERFDQPALPPPALPSQFEQDLVALMPKVNAYSRVLCSQRAIAEEMAQETFAKAWRSQESFEPGTNLKGWLFTILRNEIYSNSRRAWRNAPWSEEKGEMITTPPNQQEWTLELSDTARAMRGLQKDQRDALLLVAIGGFSYEAAAKIFGTAVGTMKSRVGRARLALLEILASNKALPERPQSQGRSGADDILTQLRAVIRTLRGSRTLPAAGPMAPTYLS